VSALIATGPQDYARPVGADRWRGYRVPAGGPEPEPELVVRRLEGWSAPLQASVGWGSWFVVSGGEVVGSCAIKAAHVGGMVEIGYGTAPARRGRGHATAAVLALMGLLAD
jgi:RimJ/RimL family protein N-acetyltransferase